MGFEDVATPRLNIGFAGFQVYFLYETNVFMLVVGWVEEVHDYA